MATGKRSNKVNRRGKFVRATLCLPAELEPFMQSRINSPEHAGNRSSYVRGLVIRDKREAEATKQAA
jgi:hypothetical protein